MIKSTIYRVKYKWTRSLETIKVKLGISVGANGIRPPYFSLQLHPDFSVISFCKISSEFVAKSGEAENRPIKPSASELIFLEVDSKLEYC
ncbi:MAG: hypothetical protein F6K39_38890 [Okeania sp. SIO3B3]|nr:hypothetical protein [Okeania sp. SIO3B3]